MKILDESVTILDTPTKNQDTSHGATSKQTSSTPEHGMPYGALDHITIEGPVTTKDIVKILDDTSDNKTLDKLLVSLYSSEDSQDVELYTSEDGQGPAPLEESLQ